MSESKEYSQPLLWPISEKDGCIPLRELPVFQDFEFKPKSEFAQYLSRVHFSGKSTSIQAAKTKAANYQKSNPTTQLHADHIAMIALYTADSGTADNFYSQLNQVLRNRGDFTPWMDAIYLIDQGLRLLPASVCNVKRGVPFTADLSKYKVGNTVVWTQFSSTSAESEVAQHFQGSNLNKSTLYSLQLVQGYDISKISLIGKEKEYLLPLASEFQVQAIFDNKIELKQVFTSPVFNAVKVQSGERGAQYLDIWNLLRSAAFLAITFTFADDKTELSNKMWNFLGQLEDLIPQMGDKEWKHRKICARALARAIIEGTPLTPEIIIQLADHPVGFFTVERFAIFGSNVVNAWTSPAFEGMGTAITRGLAENSKAPAEQPWSYYHPDPNLAPPDLSEMLPPFLSIMEIRKKALIEAVALKTLEFEQQAEAARAAALEKMKKPEKKVETLGGKKSDTPKRHEFSKHTAERKVETPRATIDDKKEAPRTAWRLALFHATLPVICFILLQQHTLKIKLESVNAKHFVSSLMARIGHFLVTGEWNVMQAAHEMMYQQRLISLCLHYGESAAGSTSALENRLLTNPKLSGQTIKREDTKVFLEIVKLIVGIRTELSKHRLVLVMGLQKKGKSVFSTAMGLTGSSHVSTENTRDVFVHSLGDYFHLVDCPGINDISGTRNGLGRLLAYTADAALVFLDAENPNDEQSLRLLINISQVSQVNKLAVAVIFNKADQLYSNIEKDLDPQETLTRSVLFESASTTLFARMKTLLDEMETRCPYVKYISVYLTSLSPTKETRKTWVAARKIVAPFDLDVTVPLNAAIPDLRAASFIYGIRGAAAILAHLCKSVGPNVYDIFDSAEANERYAALWPSSR